MRSVIAVQGLSSNYRVKIGRNIFSPVLRLTRLPISHLRHHVFVLPNTRDLTKLKRFHLAESHMAPDRNPTFSAGAWLLDLDRDMMFSRHGVFLSPGNPNQRIWLVQKQFVGGGESRQTVLRWGRH